MIDYWEQRALDAESELRDAKQVIAILIERAGGEVTLADAEIVAVSQTPDLMSMRDDVREGLVLRVGRPAYAPGID